MKAKIAFLDLETAPNVGYVWGRYEQDVIEFLSESYLLCFTVKWQGGKIETHSLPDYPLFKKDGSNDRELAKKLWQVMDEADIIVAHNGDHFDIKKANTYFIKHGLSAPSPYKTVDTLKIARGQFMFNGNRLDHLGAYLQLGRKLPNTGFHLWKGCMSGDKKSWALMKRYNQQDVILLEKIYENLRGWAPNHPNVNVVSGHDGCPKCGSTKLQKRGWRFSKLGRAQAYQCQNPKCRAWSAGPTETIGLTIR